MTARRSERRSGSGALGWQESTVHFLLFGVPAVLTISDRVGELVGG